MFVNSMVETKRKIRGTKQMNQVFERTCIGGIKLENRIFRSATNEGMGDKDGFPADELLTVYERLAKNKVGAIVTGYVAVHPSGRVTPNMCLFDDNKYIDKYRRISAKVREYNVPLILQLNHGGGQCSADIVKHTTASSSANILCIPNRGHFQNRK